MIEKLKQKLKVGEPVYTLSDYGSDVLIHFIFVFIEDIILLIGSCTAFLFLPNILFAFVLVMLATGILIVHIRLVLKFRAGQIEYLEGYCNETEKNMKSIGFSFIKKEIYGRSDVKLNINDKTYIVPVPHASKLKEGNLVRVYINENNIFQQDEDTFVVPNPVFVSLRKN